MADEQLSTAELVKQASEQLSGLVRSELRLATAELKGKAKQGGVGGGLLAGAGLAAFLGVAALLVAVGAALALVMPVWVAALLVALALLIVAGVLALVGKGKLARAVPPVPKETMASVSDDLTELRTRARR